MSHKHLHFNISQTIGERHDIKLIMNTWTRQMGYPVITVIRDGNNYILQQDRFLLDGNSSLGPPSIYE
jgi:aminopeptidase N